MINLLRTYSLVILGIMMSIAIIMYFTLPLGYSKTVCTNCFIFYLIAVFLIAINNIKQTFITFDTVFALSYLYTNFIYPVFLYETNYNFSLFRFGFNDRYITHCTLLALIGYLAYALFRIGFFVKCTPKRERFNILISNKLKHISICSMFFLCLLYIKNIRTDYTQVDIGSIGGYLQDICNTLILYLLFASSCNSKSIKDIFNKLGISFCVMLLITIFVQLLIGSRTFTLRIGLIVLFLYNTFIHRLNIIKFCALLFVGAFFMFSLGASRNGSDGTSISKYFFVNIGEELIINNRSLYVLTEYADTNGFSFGKSFLMNICSIIPYGNTILNNAFNLSEEDTHSGYKNTMITFKYDRTISSEEQFIGLGTNLIGDIYLSFGLFGVISLMSLLGYLIAKSDNLKYQSFVWLMFYGMFFMNAIYYPRSEYFNLMRIFGWTYFLYYYLNKRNKKWKKI